MTHLVIEGTFVFVCLRGGGGGGDKGKTSAHTFFARAPEIVYYSFLVGVHELLQVTLDKLFRQ